MPHCKKWGVSTPVLICLSGTDKRQKKQSRKGPSRRVVGNEVSTFRKAGFSGNAGCFIATAAYGTPYAHEIDVLRRWRDSTLVTTLGGQLFVRGYYSISPYIAIIISKSNILKYCTRVALKPVVSHFNKRE